MSSRDVDVPKHEVVARYTASKRRVKSMICASKCADANGVDRERGARIRTEDGHPLNARIAERSWGAPLVRRSADVVVKTPELIDA